MRLITLLDPISIYNCAWAHIRHCLSHLRQHHYAGVLTTNIEFEFNYELNSQFLFVLLLLATLNQTNDTWNYMSYKNFK